MKKVLMTINIVVITFVIYPIQEVIIVTDDVSAPFTFTDSSGDLTGIYIEIVKTAVSMMPDYSVSFRILPWERAKNEVKHSKAFALLPPYYHAHDWLTDDVPRRPYIWPYSEPLFTQYDVVIFNNKSFNETIDSYPEGLKGLDVVMLRGDGRAGVAFDQMVENKEVFLTLVNKNEHIIPHLLTNKSDCTIVSMATFGWYVKQMKESGEYQKYDRKGILLKEVFTIGSNIGYLGYTDVDDEKNYPYKDDFSKKFDHVIIQMKESGEIDKIAKSFIQ